MSPKTSLLLLALNFVAVGVLYSRFSSTDAGSKLNVQLQSYLSSVFPSKKATCGLLHWDGFVLVSERVVLPDGVRPAAVHVAGGKIVDVTFDTTISGPKVLNFKNAVIAPGVMDVHVHLNEPGRTEWEGISTGTSAAAVGGITTVVDMPLNSDPVTTRFELLIEKQELAKAKAHVNVAYWGGLVPANADRHDVLRKLLDHGALGFKSFMCHSGINDFPDVQASHIAAALPLLKSAGATFFVHAEVVSPVEGLEGSDPTKYSTWLRSRPPKFEQDAIKLLIDLLDKDTTPAAPGFKVHIAHLADASAIPMIQEAQKRHPITAETCAHYLTFAAEDVPDGKTLYKCAPPLRDHANRVALIENVVGGAISLISSDHSPAPPDMKQLDTGNFMKAWGGISGLQYLLPATWTHLQPYGVGLSQLFELLSAAPARLAGLDHRKGSLKKGYDADIVVWEPESPANTTQTANRHRHTLSPYTDVPLYGKVSATIVKGHFVHLFNMLPDKPCGGPISKN